MRALIKPCLLPDRLDQCQAILSMTLEFQSPAGRPGYPLDAVFARLNITFRPCRAEAAAYADLPPIFPRRFLDEFAGFGYRRLFIFAVRLAFVLPVAADAEGKTDL